MAAIIDPTDPKSKAEVQINMQLERVSRFFNDKENHECVMRFLNRVRYSVPDQQKIASFLSDCQSDLQLDKTYGLVPYFLSQCDKAVSNLGLGMPLTPKEIEKLIKLVAECIVIHLDPDKLPGYLSIVMQHYEDIQIGVLSELKRLIPLDFSKTMVEDSIYPGLQMDFLENVSLRSSPKVLNFVLSNAETPFDDALCERTLSDVLALRRDGALEKAKLLQEYRIKQHAKDRKESKEIAESYLTKWLGLIEMQKLFPNYRDQERNQEVIHKIIAGFIEQYGFHPELSDELYSMVRVPSPNTPQDNAIAITQARDDLLLYYRDRRARNAPANADPDPNVREGNAHISEKRRIRSRSV